MHKSTPTHRFGRLHLNAKAMSLISLKLAKLRKAAVWFKFDLEFKLVHLQQVDSRPDNMIETWGTWNFPHSTWNSVWSVRSHTISIKYRRPLAASIKCTSIKYFLLHRAENTGMSRSRIARFRRIRGRIMQYSSVILTHFNTQRPQIKAWIIA